MTLVEGASAPDFSLPDADGHQIRLSALRGHPVIVYFYPKDDTSGCTAQARDFTCMADQFKAAGAEILGISPDGTASHRKFRDKHDLGVRLLADEGRSAIDAYGVWAAKSLYGRNYMGVERTTFLIDAQGRIVRIWRKVRVPGHVEEVLEATQALQG